MAVESTLESRFDALAARLASRTGDLAKEYVRRVSVAVPEWTVDRPDLAATVRTGAEQSMGTELRALAYGARPLQACPEVDAEGARYAARLGVPLNVVLQQYRLGHAIQWEAWFELVEEEEPDPDARRELLERGSRFFFDYADRMCRFATEEYTDERERGLRGREQRRVQLVREALDGRDVAGDTLGYDLDGVEHVGVIAWGHEAADCVRELARGLDRRLLIVGAAEETWWAWLGARERGGGGAGARAGGLGGAAAADLAPAPDERLDRALARLRPPHGGRLAVGAPASHREGFRRTHRQAVAAQRAGAHSLEAVVRYEDVALESLAATDQAAARECVALELRGLDGGGDARSARLRETLRAWFACGQNAAATAALLGVHEQTVAHRLRAVEERTGRTVATRRAELETALRLRRYLAAPPG
jgi:hypothetical protein